MTIAEFTSLNDVALFVRYRHDQATHDAFIKAHEHRSDTTALLTSAEHRQRGQRWLGPSSLPCGVGADVTSAR